MRVSLVFTTLLCFTTWKSSDHKPYFNCCLKYSPGKNPMKWIKRFTVQTKGLCQIDAIVFYTKSKGRICADPVNPWTIDTVERIRMLFEKIHQSLHTKTRGTICSNRNGNCAKEDVLKVYKMDRKVRQKLQKLQSVQRWQRWLRRQSLHTKTRGTICSDRNGDCAKEDVLKEDEVDRKIRQKLLKLHRLQRWQRWLSLHTKTGGTICSDRNGDCAKEDVLKEDEEDRKNTLQENGQNDEGAASNMTPAPATTSTYTTQRENGQNDEGATSNITPTPATTSTHTTVTCASGVCSAHVTTTQRENGQNDEGATSDITPTTATTSKLHLTEKPKVQWENGPKTFCLRNHNTSHSYHRQQSLLSTIVLLLLYCINSKHMWN